MTDNKLKIIGISGSPRIASTDYAVKTALSYAEEKHGAETDYFSVHKKQINFCIHCDYCVRKKQGCVHKDDMVELYPKLEWADAWILGSPVYQGAISGQLKTVLDRLRASVAREKNIFAGKVGAGLAVGGDRIGGQEPVIKTMIDFFIINKMIPVGGGAFGANLGITFWSRDKKAEGAEADDEGIKTIQRTIDHLVKVALKFKD
ncbi:MAG: flavodoxin family protein [Deltaproteobacteria bacterium]|nr:flavodoxin family protein [Deltaproteobacteria bacterium]